MDSCADGCWCAAQNVGELHSCSTLPPLNCYCIGNCSNFKSWMATHLLYHSDIIISEFRMESGAELGKISHGIDSIPPKGIQLKKWTGFEDIRRTLWVYFVCKQPRQVNSQCPSPLASIRLFQARSKFSYSNYPWTHSKLASTLTP